MDHSRAVEEVREGRGWFLPCPSFLLLYCFYLHVLHSISSSDEEGTADWLGDPGSALPPYTPSAGTDLGRRFREEEIAQHNNPDDLWLIINGKVYDFTEYLPLHPGGEAILRNAGRDSTEGFSGSQHPARVWDMVNRTALSYQHSIRTQISAKHIRCSLTKSWIIALHLEL